MSEEIKIFCENVKKLRKQVGLSKREMAKKLGIGVPTLTSIESGVLPPRLSCSVVFEIEKCFGVAPGKMFLPHSFTK